MATGAEPCSVRSSWLKPSFLLPQDVRWDFHCFLRSDADEGLLGAASRTGEPWVASSFRDILVGSFESTEVSRIDEAYFLCLPIEVFASGPSLAAVGGFGLGVASEALVSLFHLLLLELELLCQV